LRRLTKAVGGLLSAAALAVLAGPTVPAAHASTVAAACPDANLVPARDNLPRVEAAVLCLINRERSRANLAALTRSSQLDRSSAWHDTEMVQHHFLSETAPGRTTLIERIRAFGYFNGVKNALYSENVGAGPTTNGTAQALMDAWMASPPHKANILYGNFSDIGIAAVLAPPDPAFFADYPSTVYTTDFGRRFATKPRCVVRKRKHSSSRQAAPRRRYCRKR
jgi:uncharacterized protein YkwD